MISRVKAITQKSISIIHIIGRSCRLPAASSVADFWALLSEGRAGIGQIGGDRWNTAHYYHPLPAQRGKTYTFAAGIIESLWSFDVEAFGVSPREAAQMDPQQRLAMKLAWEALEDAGIIAAELGGERVGVYAGASAADHGNRMILDPAQGDTFTMTGNALSLIANRVSHHFDFKGPSLTIDTACSSSLVALHHAASALRSGEISVAVVIGVNALLNPVSFSGFASARMLSPEGKCRAFGANPQGYVRSEGGVALVLAAEGVGRSHAQLLATGVNSDGHTFGVAMPSQLAQSTLLTEVYQRASVHPDEITFIEAHGTGTKAGDAAEAAALGHALGKPRSTALPIGSVKSNIGHLEPASGLAGVLKAILALEHDLLPMSLHTQTLNPDIPFVELNLCVAQTAIALPADSLRGIAGINSFGFGGANAHAVISRDRRKPSGSLVNGASLNGADKSSEAQAEILLLSAYSEAALKAMARAYALRIEGGADWRKLAVSTAYARDLAPHRLAVRGGDGIAAFLAGFGDGAENANTSAARALGKNLQTVFVFAGNGCQWAGMGLSAYTSNAAFHREFDLIREIFKSQAGWSLIEALKSPELETRLQSTMTGQALLFAIQSASFKALYEMGLTPQGVLGHSVGEVAAAYAAGALDRKQAVKVIVERSAQQEMSRGLGAMAAVSLPAAEMTALMENGGADAVIAALNSPNAVTISGASADVDRLIAVARDKGAGAKRLDLDYPFHSRFMDQGRDALLAALNSLRPSTPKIPFYSTVTGREVCERDLDAAYWWRNIREPVQFESAVRAAASAGAQVFIEVGPRAILGGYITATLSGGASKFCVLKSLDRRDTDDNDPLLMTFARAMSHGAIFDRGKAFGKRPAVLDDLPLYPFQEQDHKLIPTGEALLKLAMPGTRNHPLLGEQPVDDACIWRAHMDTAIHPFLADHKAGGKVILPGAAFADMALAAASRWLKSQSVEIRDMDIVQPLILDENTLCETQVRLSPDSSVIEISSRDRFTDDWRRHATCRFAIIPAEMASGLSAPREFDVNAFDPARIYAIAKQRGLEYGPAFKRLAALARPTNDVIELRLTASEIAGAFSLQPMELDACFHGLFALLDGDDAETMGMSAYIPVRFGALRLYHPESNIHTVRITVNRASEHSIEADFALFDGAGNLIATLNEARFKAVAFVTRPPLASIAYHMAAEKIALPGLQNVLPPMTSFVAFSERGGEEGDAPHEARLLLDAAAYRIAYDAMRAVASGGLIDLQAAQNMGLVHPERVDYFHRLVSWLQHAAFAEAEGSCWRLSPECVLPQVAEVIATVVAEHPGWSAECVMASRATALLPQALAIPADEAVYSQSTRDHFTHSPRFLKGIEAVTAWALRIRKGIADGAPLRILELGAGSGALTLALASIVAPESGRLVCAGPSQTIRRISHSMRGAIGVEFTELDADAATRIAAAGPFDVVVSGEGLGGVIADAQILKAVRAAMVPGGLLAATLLSPGAFGDVVLGLTGMDTGHRTADEWTAALHEAGFIEAFASMVGDFMTLSAVAPHLNTASTPRELRAAIIVEDPQTDTEFSLATSASLKDAGFSVWPARVETLNQTFETARKVFPALAGHIDIVDLTGIPTTSPNASAWLAKRLAELQLQLSLSGAATTVWITAPGGARAATPEVDAPCPLAAALWAGVRTAMNENPGVAIRLSDFAESLSATQRAKRLAAWISQPGGETELVLAKDAAYALRARSGMPFSMGGQRAEHAAVLKSAQPGSLDHLIWSQTERRAPGKSEVEISVEATGLNFRDVMWALGMLPPEALEDGFAGPTLGFECAGRVVRTGEGVADLRAGDLVAGMAPAALSSHVTVARRALALVPQHLSAEAAATLPVAFLTAYYSLVHLARLEEGEWTLIHGGAGGVGLAALQIARMRGARVIVTAGSKEKRDFLRMLGAEHTLDSRSLAFTDEVRRLTGEGPSVVLNSLAGEAMERSIELVRPFGRFIELGKRDFYGNTKIGLRPFRRNISYFGVDADQLLASQPMLAARMLTEVMGHINAGDLTPLPYRRFSGHEAGDAFRLMQQSGHIGKIVITPPTLDTVAATPAPAPFHACPDGFHVIIGGLGGFGLETARWLGDSGARRIALVSRSGKLRDDRTASVLDALRQSGVDIRQIACDASSREALETILAQLRQEARIAGVIHAAMLLDDAPLAQIDEARLQAIISPKVAIADNLHELTQNDALGYFVLYSSVSAFIGNPGQAAYAAANAYLEALAVRRRSEKLPALAVGWGPISDAGYLARNLATADIIQRRMGAQTFTARDALNCLGELLSLSQAGIGAPAVTIAPMDWNMAAASLAVFQSPAFASLNKGRDQAAIASAGPFEVAALIDGLSEHEARLVIARYIAEDVASIFRMPASDISGERPLADLGMDSLMLVELQTAAQWRFGFDIPLTSATDALTINSIAFGVTSRLRSGTRIHDDAATMNGILREHAGGPVNDVAIKTLSRRIQLGRNESLLA
ncbi:MAG: SDR family NAD(P)-dependent oxidoreductase [Hyphomicrobiales bacterium]|nr:SDR family NAD(P)-dependent oxidoreductase [Hyphomicrobiales bacterium]